MLHPMKASDLQQVKYQNPVHIIAILDKIGDQISNQGIHLLINNAGIFEKQVVKLNC